jgi:hypothetical protein
MQSRLKQRKRREEEDFNVKVRFKKKPHRNIGT